MATSASAFSRLQLGELLAGVRQQVDADAERLDLRRGLEYAAGNAGLMQPQAQGEAPDAGADNDHVHCSTPPAFPSPRSRAGRSIQEAVRAGIVRLSARASEVRDTSQQSSDTNFGSKGALAKSMISQCRFSMDCRPSLNELASQLLQELQIGGTSDQHRRPEHMSKLAHGSPMAGAISHWHYEHAASFARTEVKVGYVAQLPMSCRPSSPRISASSRSTDLTSSSRGWR